MSEQRPNYGAFDNYMPWLGRTLATAARRSWSKWRAGVAASALVMVVAIGSACGSGGNDQGGAAKPSTDTPAATTATAKPTDAPAPTSTPASTNTPVPTNTPRPSPTATPTPAPPEYISGLTAADVTKNLEPRGFKCRGPRSGQTMQLWDCSSGDGNIQVSFMGASPTRIRSVSATALGSDAASFLRFLASLPYKDADPAKAQEWVTANVAAGGETVIGSARFVISGPAGARSLDIVAIGAK